MKKSTLILAAAMLGIGTVALAQRKADDPKHENWYKNQKFDTEEMAVEIVDINAQSNVCKMKIKITNKTNDYILYKPEETEFVYEFGTYNPKGGLSVINGKNELIDPKSNNSRVLNVTGDTRFHVESFSVNFKGFYRISSKGTVIKAPDFTLPASTNDFEVGPFKVLMTAISKETQQTAIRFKVTYANDNKHYGLVSLGKAVMRIESGQEFAMANQKDKQVLLSDGQDDKFNYYYEIPASIVDMQFANMWVVWKETFRESEMAPMSVKPVTFTKDPGLTEGKNK